jgi:hypothetical protein
MGSYSNLKRNWIVPFESARLFMGHKKVTIFPVLANLKQNGHTGVMQGSPAGKSTTGFLTSNLNWI